MKKPIDCSPEIIEGDTRLLLIAPHGKIEKPMDDMNTGFITQAVAESLGCSAIINYKFNKKKKKGVKWEDVINFNDVSVEKRCPEFIQAIKKVVDSEGKTFVVWIHGIHDDNIEGEAGNPDTDYNGDKEDLHALIGYGQAEDPRYTAEEKTTSSIIALLKKNGMTAVPARLSENIYRARSESNMNQWFRKNKYKFSDVESLQIEIKEKGFREKDNINRTAEILSNALGEYIDLQTVNKLPAPVDKTQPETEIESSPDEALVEKAYSKLSDIVVKHLRVAMIEAGNYLIKEFYDNDFELARTNKSLKNILCTNSFRNFRTAVAMHHQRRGYIMQ